MRDWLTRFGIVLALLGCLLMVGAAIARWGR